MAHLGIPKVIPNIKMQHAKTELSYDASFLHVDRLRLKKNELIQWFQVA